MKRHDARIIVLSGYVDKLRQVLCEAYKQGFYGPRYVWMIPEFYPEGWWAVEDGHRCTGNIGHFAIFDRCSLSFYDRAIMM